MSTKKLQIIGSIGSGTSVQPDCNQNDNTASDYIKNRTHYDAGEEIEIELLPSTDLTFEQSDFTYMSETEISFAIEVGSKYVVTIDGVEYVCTAILEEDYGDMITLGESYSKNMLFMKMGIPAEYNKPFTIIDDGGYLIVIMLTSTETTHNVKISKIGSYINKDIYNKSGVKFDLIDGQYSKYVFDIETPIAGLDYTITWDGTEYICKAVAPDEGVILLGNMSFIGENTGEPFVFVSEENGTMNSFVDMVNAYTAEESKTVNIAIDKLLEDGAYESLTANTDYTLTYDSEITCYISNILIENAVLEIGNTYKITYNNTEYTCVCTDLDGLPAVGDPTIIPYFTSYESTGEPFLMGYSGEGIFIYGRAEIPEIYHDVKLSGYVSGVKKLDKKYIPPMSTLTFDGYTRATYDGSNNVDVYIPYPPTSLKNPYALTFTGAVSGSYDGSSATTINIPTSLPSVTSSDNSKVLGVVNGAWAKTNLPTSLKNPYALTFTGSVTKTYDGSKAINIEIPTNLPDVTTDNNGAFLRVVDGAYALVNLTDVSTEGA